MPTISTRLLVQRPLGPSDRVIGMCGGQMTGQKISIDKIVALRSPTPGVDMERIVGLRAYQEMGGAAVSEPITDTRVREVCDRVKSKAW